MPKHQPKTIIALAVAVGLLVATPPGLSQASDPPDCKDVEIIFARGSGEELNGENYHSFQTALTPKLGNLKYNFYELGTAPQGMDRYEAVSIDGLKGAAIIATAAVSGGRASELGQSVDKGVKELKNYIGQVGTACPGTKFVLAGYSQGAMVMSKAMRYLDADKIIYVATFGDPKLYLPEGKGLTPPACKDETSLSDYRAYVPDCRAYQGILGALKPYRSASYSGKVGVWCNYNDLMCSSKINWANILGAHTSYVSDHRYEDAAELISDKIHAATDQVFTTTAVRSTHDAVFLFDSSWSMQEYLYDFRNLALRIGTGIMDQGGRVALYEYRDLADPFNTRELCNFETCTKDGFRAALNGITANGGNDESESLLSAALTAMNNLHWQVGAKKSTIVLTDAGFHSPDRDGVRLEQVITRSQEIDPVHFNIITPANPVPAELHDLASATGGEVFDFHAEPTATVATILNLDAEPLLFDDGDTSEVPIAQNLRGTRESDKLIISFETTAYRTLLIINETPIGFTAETSLTISDLDFSEPNTITLVPFSETGRRGENATFTFPAELPIGQNNREEPTNGARKLTPTTIGVPATGFAKENH